MSSTPTPACSSTPVASGQKRDCSSSLELSDIKKHRLNSSSSISSISSEQLQAMEFQPETSSLPVKSTTVSGLSSEDLSTITDSLKSTLLKEFQQMVQSAVAGSLASTIPTIVKPIVEGVLGGLTKRIDGLEAENKELRDRVARLEQSADAAEQYSRRNCLRISGVKEVDGEDTDKYVLTMASAIGADISITDIDRSHRVGKMKDIIVKFATYRARKRFFKARVKARSTGYSGVYVNEDLTRSRSTILYKARTLVKSKSINSCWSSDGTILVKDLSMKVHRIEGIADLSKF